LVSLVWGVALVGGALGFYHLASGSDTPVVVLALSIASVTYGALLGAYILAGTTKRYTGPDVITAALMTVVTMLCILFSGRMAAAGLTWLEPVSHLAWPWYVPLGTLIMLVVAYISSRFRVEGDIRL